MTTQESKLTDAIDLMRDEFRRIKACPADKWVKAEIDGLCDRAITKIEQTVPVIVQRDAAEKKAAALERENKRLRDTIAEYEEQWIDEHV